jgi:hypothetical protein
MRCNCGFILNSKRHEEQLRPEDPMQALEGTQQNGHIFDKSNFFSRNGITPAKEENSSIVF